MVSGQRRRFTYFRVEIGLDMGLLLPEEWDSSPQNWDAPKHGGSNFNLPSQDFEASQQIPFDLALPRIRVPTM